MEAKELMIGDWVYDERFNQYHKVNLEHDFHYMCDGELCFEPIHLTAEILEMNGFEIFKRLCWTKRYRIIDNDMVVVVEPMKIESRLGNSWFWVTISHRSDVVQPTITYPLVDVHTFQHILRDGGLNELADNFKVE